VGRQRTGLQLRPGAGRDPRRRPSAGRLLRRCCGMAGAGGAQRWPVGSAGAAQRPRLRPPPAAAGPHRPARRPRRPRGACLLPLLRPRHARQTRQRPAAALPLRPRHPLAEGPERDPGPVLGSALSQRRRV